MWTSYANCVDSNFSTYGHSLTTLEPQPHHSFAAVVYLTSWFLTRCSFYPYAQLVLNSALSSSLTSYKLQLDSPVCHAISWGREEMESCLPQGYLCKKQQKLLQMEFEHNIRISMFMAITTMVHISNCEQLKFKTAHTFISNQLLKMLVNWADHLY